MTLRNIYFIGKDNKAYGISKNNQCTFLYKDNRYFIRIDDKSYEVNKEVWKGIKEWEQ